QARCTVGADEDKTKDMGRFVEAVDHLREATGAAVLNIHHTGWSKENQRERGASAIRGAADTVMLATQKDSTVGIQCLKQKDAPGDGRGGSDHPRRDERDLLGAAGDSSVLAYPGRYGAHRSRGRRRGPGRPWQSPLTGGFVAASRLNPPIPGPSHVSSVSPL